MRGGWRTLASDPEGRRARQPYPSEALVRALRDRSSVFAEVHARAWDLPNRAPSISGVVRGEGETTMAQAARATGEAPMKQRERAAAAIRSRAVVGSCGCSRRCG